MVSIMVVCAGWGSILLLELGDIMILSFIVILNCHNNRNRGEIFNIIISLTQYYRKYHKYHEYRKIHCSETFISVKCFKLSSQF